MLDEWVLRTPVVLGAAPIEVVDADGNRHLTSSDAPSEPAHDLLLVEVPSVGAAVDCAVDLQRRAAGAGASLAALDGDRCRQLLGDSAEDPALLRPRRRGVADRRGEIDGAAARYWMYEAVVTRRPSKGPPATAATVRSGATSPEPTSATSPAERDRHRPWRRTGGWRRTACRASGCDGAVP